MEPEADTINSRPNLDEASDMDPALVSALYDRVKTLESKIESIEVEQKIDGDFKTEPTEDGLDATDDIKAPTAAARGGWPERLVTIPKVRKCNIHEFKNRFSSDDGRYAVAVLYSGPLIDDEIQEELRIRQNVSKSRPKGPKANKVGKKTRFAESKVNLVEKAVRKKGSASKWAQRIRIQSPAILQILAREVEESWTSRPRTFFRPFSLLIYYHAKMKEALAELEAKFGALDDPDTPGTPTSLPSARLSASVDDCPEAMRDMRAYVQFMEEEIVSDYKRFESRDGTSDVKVRFDDLWFLFRHGETVWRPLSEGTDKANSWFTRQRCWRVYGISTPLPRYRISHIDSLKYSHREADDVSSCFVLYCYYIDYTGNGFCAVKDKFVIPRYQGDLSVQSLGVYPIRFCKGSEALSRPQQEMASRNFLIFLKAKHALYNWWTLVCDPTGKPITDAEGNDVKHPTHIHSDVIVDFDEAFQVCPAWQPQPSIFKPHDSDASSTADEFFVNWWADADRSKLLSEASEIIQLRSGVDIWEMNRQLDRDHFIASLRENEKIGRQMTSEDLRPADLDLLPSRVFAYVLLERKFVQIDALRLRPVRENPNAFENLKINPMYKKTVQAIVESHFMKKSSEKMHGIEGMSQDLIHGKGRGLVVLLHGVPGVGKTATAEAVAQANGKPLFAITCGDLGITPKDVESSLSEIFRLAHQWDCVLLLDEVDTFFTQRTRGDGDLTKNALVSVFLRVLEYYNGILFLTTNRPGTLDEAFKSRIHMKLYYPPLDYQQTVEIWQMNIERLKVIEQQRHKDTGELPLEVLEEHIMRFAVEQFRRHQQQPDSSKGRWNGRQIRNAFQIASSLAYYETRKMYDELRAHDPDQTPLRPRLKPEHFAMIDDLTHDFDQYMEETLGKSDPELALEHSERADHWRAPARPAGSTWQSNTDGPSGSSHSINYGYGSGPGTGHEPGFSRDTPPAGLYGEAQRHGSGSGINRTIDRDVRHSYHYPHSPALPSSNNPTVPRTHPGPQSYDYDYDHGSGGDAGSGSSPPGSASAHLHPQHHPPHAHPLRRPVMGAHAATFPNYAAATQLPESRPGHGGGGGGAGWAGHNYSHHHHHRVGAGYGPSSPDASMSYRGGPPTGGRDSSPPPPAPSAAADTVYLSEPVRDGPAPGPGSELGSARAGY